MATMILPREEMKRILKSRRAHGLDRYDEVWNGVYVMSPIANNEHQFFATHLAILFSRALDHREDVIILAGTNVTDQAEDWTKNYRVPDVAVFLPGNTAEDRKSHYYGGPDFAVEVVSRGDRSRKKVDFYAGIGVREFLLVDRDPWRLELFRADGGVLRSIGAIEPGDGSSLVSEVLPLSFRLIASSPRPKIEATRPLDGHIWSV